MIGSFAYCQDMNEIMLDGYDLPDFFPSNELIKNNKIKSLTNLYYVGNHVHINQTICYDSIGRKVKYINFNPGVPNEIINNSTFIYKHYLTIIVDSTINSHCDLEKRSVSYHYLNINKKDSLLIDSSLQKDSFVLGYKTCFQYYPENNIIKDIIIFQNVDSGKLNSNWSENIKEYFYDTLYRIIKASDKYNYTDRSIVSYTRFKYKNNRVIVYDYDFDKECVSRRLYFDDKKRLIKIKTYEGEGNDSYSLFYDDKHCIRKDNIEGQKEQFTYLMDLPLKSISSYKKDKDFIQEYRYEFY